MSNHRHEDLHASVITVGTSNSTTVTAFSGTEHPKIHHINAFNTSSLVSVDLKIKAYEGGIGQFVILRNKTLEPEGFVRWAGAAGADDYIVIECTNESKDYDVAVHLAWW